LGGGGHPLPLAGLGPVEADDLGAVVVEGAGGLQAGEDADVVLGGRPAEHDADGGHGMRWYRWHAAGPESVASPEISAIRKTPGIFAEVQTWPTRVGPVRGSGRGDRSPTAPRHPRRGGLAPTGGRPPGRGRAPSPHRLHGEGRGGSSIRPPPGWPPSRPPRERAPRSPRPGSVRARPCRG